MTENYAELAARIRLVGMKTTIPLDTKYKKGLVVYNILYGERFKSKRLEIGLNLTQLASILDVSVGFLSNIEHGLKKPGYELEQRVCAVLRTTSQYLHGL